MDRHVCAHMPRSEVLLVVRWCVRCSGWQVRRLGVDCGSSSVIGSPELYESHFLPVDDTGPDELQPLIQRVFRCAQEWEQDAQNV